VYPQATNNFAKGKIVLKGDLQANFVKNETILKLNFYTKFWSWMSGSTPVENRYCVQNQSCFIKNWKQFINTICDFT